MDLRACRRPLLDTVACIYFLEGAEDDPRRAAIQKLVRSAEAGDVELLVSVLTLTELLVGPIRAGDRPAEARARLFLGELCGVVPVDVAIAEVAARLRARYGLRTPDAIICATGIGEQADAVVGNESRWKRVTEINYIHLDDRGLTG